MKRQPIPQFEFGFSDEPFALVPEKQSAPAAPVILAEMTPEERERMRERSTGPCQEEIEMTREIEQKRIADGSRSERIRQNRAAMDCEHLDETTPGLREGSYWSAPMVKALATMQGGGR